MKLKFWIKAFIPDSLPTATGQELTFRAKVLELSDNSDTSLLPLLTLFPYLYSYATDQRTYSNNVKASARITTVLDLPDHPEGDVTVQRYSDPTHQLRGKWMNLFCKAQSPLESKTSQPKGKQVIKREDKSLHVAFSSSGCNPFFQICGLDYAPSIAMDFNLGLNFNDPDRIGITLNGRVSQFPAFEAYLQVDDKDPTCLIRHYPPKGNTPLNLLSGWTPISVIASLARTPAPRVPAGDSSATEAKAAELASKEEIGTARYRQ